MYSQNHLECERGMAAQQSSQHRDGPVCRKIKTLTNGELEIVVQYGGALGFKGPELLKAVRDGLVPISDIFTGGVAGEAKIFQINTLPFLVQDMSEAKILTDIARPYFDKTAAKWKQKFSTLPPGPVQGCGAWNR